VDNPVTIDHHRGCLTGTLFYKQNSGYRILLFSYRYRSREEIVLQDIKQRWNYVLTRLCHFCFAGKLQNIEGIEKSTEDDINKDNIDEIAKSTTEDYHYKIPSPVPAVKKAPKPKTIPQGNT